MWLLLLPACRKDDAPPPADPTPADSGTFELARDDAWFAPDRLLDVSIELPPDDWDALRAETRDVFALLGGADCLSAPFESPFGTYRADVRVDGVEILGVGLSKKGFLGSLSFDRPSLKIDTDALVDGQLAPNGTERVVLNNNLSDASTLRQCLTYEVFRRAGHPAPRCNLASVRVNGRDLGVYTHVEAVRKDFLRRHFGDEDGDLYEGTLSDFVDGWTATFDPKTESTDPDGAVIARVTAAAAVPDAELWDSLSTVLDLDAFVRFWALEAVVAHVDGYTGNQNNYFVYRDPDTDLVTFVPWGTDATMVDPALPPVQVVGWLAQRLHALPEGRRAFRDEVERVLAEVWDEEALLTWIDDQEALAASASPDPDGLSVAVEQLRAFVTGRRSVLAAALASDGPPEVPPAPRDPLCLVPSGHVEASFATTWDSWALDPFAEGYTGTLEGSAGGGALPDFAYVLPLAGDDGYGNAALSVVALDAEIVDFHQLVVVVPAADLVPGTHPVDLLRAYGVLQAGPLDGSVAPTVFGYLAGEITFTEAAWSPGAPVVGTVSGDLYAL